MKSIKTAGLALALAASAGLAGPTGPRALHSTLHSQANSQAPGTPGLRFGATSGALTAYDRPFRNLRGDRWIIPGATNTGSTATDEWLFLGTGLSLTADVQEGVTQIEPGRVAESASIDTKLGINDDGDYVFTANLSGATTDDEVIVRSSGGILGVVAREGAPTSIPGATYGLTLHSPYIENSGDAAFVGTSLVGPGTALNAAGFAGDGAAVLFQKGVTIPAGQLGGGSEFWENVVTGAFYLSADGSTWLARGDMTGVTTSDGLIAVNNRVVVQEGFPLPGVSPATPNVTTLTESILSPAGHWLARGSFADTEDWLVFNGALLATSGAPVPGGLPGEVFDDAPFAATFFFMTADNAGNVVYGGTTSNPDPNFDAVLVYNSRVIARQGDPVDLNGNGAFDDDAFIDVFNNDDGVLLESGTLVFTAEVKNGAGAKICQAILALDLSTPCYPDCDTTTGPGVLDIFDFLCFQNRFDAGDPYACDCDTSSGPGVCDIFDFLCFQNAYDVGCP